MFFGQPKGLLMGISVYTAGRYGMDGFCVDHGQPVLRRYAMQSIHTQQSMIRSRGKLKAVMFSGAILSMGMLGGCDNAGEGLFTGAALGAVTGLVIGSINGDAGEGAAIGAVLGGAGGAIVGDQNERNRYNTRYGSYEYDSRPRHRSGYRNEGRRHPYCSTHRVYHIHHSQSDSHHGSNGHGYGYSEWWND